MGILEWNTAPGLDPRTRHTYNRTGMDQASKIIELFGGIRPMARKLSRALGRRVPPTTVQGWVQRGIIPANRQGEVLAAAAAEAIALTPADFFEAQESRRGTGEGQAASDALHPIDGAGPELLSVEEMATADRLTIDGGTPGVVLMEAAGQGIADAIKARFPKLPVTILCGPGNNGGDGFVIARHLAAAGWPLRLALLGKESKLQGDAAVNAQRWREMSGAMEPLSAAALDGAGMIVDALFGAGLARPLEGTVREVVEKAATIGVPIVAVDIPSGIQGDSGAVLGAAAPARFTVTFFRKKPGHLLMPGKAFAGEVQVIDIGITAKVLDEIHPTAFENGPAIWCHDFPWPGPDAHKYSRGHLVIGGGRDMTGAARLAARSALRIGAGLVTIATAPEAVPVYASCMPGVLTCPVQRAGDFTAYLDDPRRRAVLLGPGYGVDQKTHTHVLTALALEKRVCLDADALTVFTHRGPELFAAIAANAGAGGGAVLTPHEGEFARLFPHLARTGSSGLDKLSRARAAARESGATVLIKGSDTVIAAPDGRALINANGPPDLATGGSGDVLAGLIAGLMVQGVGPFESAGMAAWIHGAAAGRFGPGLIAEDLPDCIPGVLRDLQRWNA